MQILKCYAIYYKGLEHLLIWVSDLWQWCLRNNLPKILRDSCILRKLS